MTIKYGFILLILLFICFSSCYNFRTSNASTIKAMKKKGVLAEFIKDSFNGVVLNCLKTGSQNENCVLFIHGAPGANDAFKEFMSDSILLSLATLIAIDRPGYGYSSREKSYYSIEDQSKSIGHLIKELKSKYKKLLIVGHSYGATLVAKLCMENNSYIDAAMQISGAVDPNNERIFWFSKLANSPLVYWTLSRTLKVATNEKMNHVRDIQLYLKEWDSIQMPYTVIHGDKDNLVPYINFTYSKNKLVNTDVKMITVQDGGHLLIWKDFNLVRDEIVLLLK